MNLRFLILFIFCIILESTVMPLPLTFLAVYLSLTYFDRRLLSTVFAAGIILDLFATRLVGLSSFIFLSVYIAGSGFGKQIRLRHVISQMVLISVSLLFYLVLFYSYSYSRDILIIGISIGILLLSRRLFPLESAGGKKLAI